MKYKKMSDDELYDSVTRHWAWLYGEDNGDRLNLSNYSLRDRNMENYNLPFSSFVQCDLSGSNLTGANLYDSDLTECALINTNLTNVKFIDARLILVELYNADLTGANLNFEKLTLPGVTTVRENGVEIELSKLLDKLRDTKNKKLDPLISEEYKVPKSELDKTYQVDPVLKGDLKTNKYRFNENKIVADFEKYIAETYSQHYSKKGSQAIDTIINAGHGEGFCVGNIIKYAIRLGKKGDAEDYKKDIFKIMHYALIQLHIHNES